MTEDNKEGVGMLWRIEQVKAEYEQQQKEKEATE